MNAVNQSRGLPPDELRGKRKIQKELRLIRLFLVLGSVFVSITVAVLMGRKIGLITLVVTSTGILLVGLMVEKPASVALRRMLRRIKRLGEASWN
jgi:hypothetical protein